MYNIAPHRTAPHRTAPHRTAPHRTASHRIASHRIASHRIASHRIASHRIASHRIASHRIALLITSRFVHSIANCIAHRISQGIDVPCRHTNTRWPLSAIIVKLTTDSWGKAGTRALHLFSVYHI